MPIERAVPRTLLIAESDRRRIQIRHLLLRDILDLLQRDLSDFVFIRRARPLGNAGRPLQQHRSRRSLGDEGNERSL